MNASAHSLRRRVRRPCSFRCARPDSPALGVASRRLERRSAELGEALGHPAQDRGHAGQDRPPQGHRARPHAATSRAGRPKIRRLQGTIGALQQPPGVVQSSLDSAQGELERTQADLRFQRARQVRLRARLRQARRILAARLVERYQADAARPRYRDPQLEGLRRAARARRVPASASTSRTSGSSRSSRGAKADARDNAIRLDKLEQRQAQVAARIQERRNQIARVKQDLIDTRVGYDNTRAGKQRALMSVRIEREQLEGALSHMRQTQAQITGDPQPARAPARCRRARSAAAPGR